MELRQRLKEAGFSPATPDDNHYRPGWVNIPCWRCGSQKNHLGIKEDLSRANCYKCGSMHPAQALSKTLGLPWLAAKAEVNALDRTTFVEPEYGKYTPPTGLGPVTRHDKQHLYSRGWDAMFTEFAIQTYQLQSTNPFTNSAVRGIFIPIFNARGAPVSWTIRNTYEGDLRYLTAQAAEKSEPEKHLLYNEHLVIEHGLNTILVVEGPFDAMRLGIGAVALLGIGYTAPQVARIARYPRRVVIFDNSASAQRRAAGLCEQLAVFPGVTEQIELMSDDPGVATTAEITQVREYAGLE